MGELDVAQTTRRFLILRATRWLPTGFIIPAMTLFLLSDGLTLGQLGLAFAAQGVMIMVLELPTGGLADALGRRPVLLGASVFDLITLTVLLVADGSLLLTAIAFGMQGIYRALESGPLDAWYVDAVHAAGGGANDATDAEVARGMSRSGTVLGLSIAFGSLAGGGAIALAGRLGFEEPLAVPFMLALAVRVADTLMIRALMTEVREPLGWAAVADSVREVPEVIAGSFHLLRNSRALSLLIGVEMLWGFGMVSFETLFPARLTELVGDADRTASLMGPVAAAAWGVSAAGAALVPWFTARFGQHRTAAAMRLLQGASIIAMAWAGGAIGAITAYLGNYLIHGAANPVHQSLLHREAESKNRATVMSLNSLAASLLATGGGIVLGGIADRAGTGTGMVVGGIVIAAAAPLYTLAGRSRSASHCYVTGRDRHPAVSAAHPDRPGL